MLKIYSPYISKALPFGLMMATTTIFDLTYYDFP